DLIKELLPVLDTLDAGIAHDQKLEPVRSQLLKVLQSNGLQVIEGKGEKYDPNLMEAVGVLDQGEDGTVLEEVQKGYTLNGNIIRTSKVIVSKR
uniref:nucleotide exchange factor GrpE n=1 Tax=Ferroplasma sp. TaxID=2591003 RepID=UPI00307F2573